MKYEPKKIEPKWAKVWEQSGLYRAKNFAKKPKWYSLIEFPYPSGDGLHTGHIRSNTAMDIISRKRRMEGFNVLYPIGWDAFGLPTENYAIKTGQQPAAVTKKNTDTFRRQLKACGFSFDWEREINTTDPAYYKWTQWIFLQLFKKGLAYKQKSLINWCPKDKIGLANEEVVDGRCERCGTPVEKKEKEQWMLAITKYADRLEKDLDSVNYLEKIKLQQKNWIGRSDGAEINFDLKSQMPNVKTSIRVFTTRPDTLFGVTYVVLAPEHPLVSELWPQIENAGEIEAYVKQAMKATDQDRTAENRPKTGVELKGIKAINPANNEEVPVFIADYVLASYGTGAVMAVPAHDSRDFLFAKKYDLPVKQVIAPMFLTTEGKDAVREDKPTVKRRNVNAIIKHWAEDKYIGLDWQKYGWRSLVIGGVEEGEDPALAAAREAREETGYQNLRYIGPVGIEIHSHYYAEHKGVNRYAETVTHYFELIDDERKEIEPKEMETHRPEWVEKDKMPEFLNLGNHHFTWEQFVNGENSFDDYGILINSGEFNGKKSEDVMKEITTAVGGKWVTKYKLRDWVFSRQHYWGEPIPLVYCEQCAQQGGANAGWVPVPEKALPVELPKVKNYQPSDDGESPLSKIGKWVKTKCPVCGGPARRETDTMPNWAGSSWYFLRYADPKNSKALADPKKLKYWLPVDWYNGGMEHTTLHLLYSRFWNKFLFDIGAVPVSEPYAKRTSQGMILGEGGVKMSKSKGNVINPDDTVKIYGADTLRVYEMFMGPFDQSIAWSTESIIGSRRFLDKVWKIAQKAGKIKPAAKEETLLHKTIKKVGEDIEQMSFNTAISAMMIWANEMDKLEQPPLSLVEEFLKLLAPFAPFMTEELWSGFGHKKSIHLEKWPAFDRTKLVSELSRIVVQVNGKVRDSFEVESGAGEETVKALALEREAVKKHVAGKTVKKLIYVPGRLLNFVV